MNMQEIELRLTLAEINQILDALGQKQYKDVYQLVTKIQQQAQAQLEAQQTAVPGSPSQ
jgi:hypothetical protein